MGYFFCVGDSPLKDTTEKFLSSCEVLLLISGLVLAFGVIGEYLEDHEKLPRWMAWSSHPKTIFMWMIVISLIGEFAGDAGVFAFSGRLQTISDSEVAALNVRAASAEADAKDFESKISTAKKDTAEAKRESDELRLKLADASIPRSFEPRQAEFLKSKLPPFSGQLMIVYQAWTFDGYRFARQLRFGFNRPDVVEEEGAIQPRYDSRPDMVFRGIQIFHTSDPRSETFAESVAEILKSKPLSIEEVSVHPGLSISPNLPAEADDLRQKVVIRIGRKP